MQTKYLLIVACLVLAINASAIRAFACGMDWVVPYNHFNGVSAKGYVAYWENIGDLDLGGGLKIPLIIGFNSSRHSSSPYLGNGWILALLESHMVQLKPRLFMVTLPNGFNIRFKRQTESDSTLTGGGGTWMGSLGDHAATIWASCGWKITFTDGKISSLTTPLNQLLSYIYENGVIREVDENGAPLLTVSVNGNTGVVNGLDFNGKEIKIQQGQKPHIENINGQNVVGEVSQSLAKIEFPDGSDQSFKFAVNQNLQPTLNVSGKTTGSFIWDPITDFVVKSGNWSYKINPSGGDGTDDSPLANAQITRSDKEGHTEYWYRDAGRGRTTIIDPDGTERIKEYFTSGILMNKTRSITEIKNKIPTIVYSASYDEQGRLIRQMDNGKTKTYVYDTVSGQSRLVQILIDGKPKWTFSYDDHGNIAHIGELN